MNKRVIDVPEDAPTLILEDAAARRHFFLNRLPDAFLAYACPEAIALMKTICFDTVFLDYNLEGTHTSVECARWIAQNNYKSRIVIHSTNSFGASVLQNLLPCATWMPFSSFDIIRFKKQKDSPTRVSNTLVGDIEGRGGARCLDR